MKILLVQVSFLGDVILSTPVIEALRKKYPGAEIWMMTTPAAAELVRRDPSLSGVLCFDKRKKHSGVRGTFTFLKELRSHKFDKVYSLHKSFRTALVLYLAGIPERIGFAESRGARLYSKRMKRRTGVHDVLRNLSILDSTFTEANAPELALTSPPLDELSAPVKEFFHEHAHPIVLVPGSVWPTKRWYWERYREFAVKLLASGNQSIVLSGAPNEVEVCNQVGEGLPVVNFAGKTTLADLLFLISQAQAVICNDSMALHIASAFKIPTVSIFCATSPEFGFGPWRNRAEVVEKSDLSCKPCRRHGGKVCPTGTESCMRDVSADEVEHALLRVLGDA